MGSGCIGFYARWSALGLFVPHRGGNRVAGRCLMCPNLAYWCTEYLILVALGRLFCGALYGLFQWLSGVWLWSFFFLSFLCAGVGVGRGSGRSWLLGRIRAQRWNV